MLTNFPAPVIGALVSSAFAVAMAIYSLSVAQRSKKMETTRDVLRRYFSADFTLIRRESFDVLHAFWLLHCRQESTKSSSLIQYLISFRLDKYKFEDQRGANNLSGQQNTLLFLYFWAELEAYRKRHLLDADLVKEVLCSQWDLYRDVLIQIVLDYEDAVNRDSEQHRLAVPPWVIAIRQIDLWMRRPNDRGTSGVG